MTNDIQSATLNPAVTGQSDYILVPRVPTKEMLLAGRYEAHDEDAEGCWREMIKAWEKEKMDHERVE